MRTSSSSSTKSVTGVLHHFPQSLRRPSRFPPPPTNPSSSASETTGFLASTCCLSGTPPFSLPPPPAAIVTLLSDLLVLWPSRVARRSWTSFAQQPVRFLQQTLCVVVPTSTAVFNIRFRVLHVLHTRHHLSPEVSVALGRLHEGGAKTEVASWSRGTGQGGGGGVRFNCFKCHELKPVKVAHLP